MRTLLICVVGIGTVAALQGCAGVEGGGLLEGAALLSGPEDRQAVLAMAQAEPTGDGLAEVTIDYPTDGSIFPPDIIAPTFLWHDDSPQVDRWLIDVALGGSSHIYVVTDDQPAPAREIDERCLGVNNEVYQPTAYQASARRWTPGGQVWERIKAGSSGRPAVVTILGFSSTDPGSALSHGRMVLTTCTDPVGAPIFYRDVPLMPTENERGNIKPLPDSAIRLVTWRLRDIGRTDNRQVLTDMPTCANCHSFSLDGRTMGMDIDGPSGDKGAYGIATIEESTVITSDDIITWNAFANKPAGHKTIGFMSQISPDGQYAISTVNEEIYSAGFPHYAFLQVFYPTRGILAHYSRRTRRFASLPGADDPAYVHCDPVWSPDGEWIIFARAEARDAYIEGMSDPEYADHENETPMQYDLYRIPFNSGQGGVPERIEGASQNGMSNTFPKVSPDGRWIVSVQCRNGQLQRPDSRLWIVPVTGGEAREMNCNMSLMNSWHSFSPNGRWMVFSSKANTPYTEMFLTHIDENGNDSPPILIANATAANRAVNLPEFVNIDYDDLLTIDAPTINYYRHYERGNELRGDGLFEEAIAEYLQALETERTSTRVNNNMGLCLVRLGRYAEAVEYYHAALELFPNDPRSVTIYGNLGFALAAQRKYDEAIEQYSRALELDPSNLMVHTNMAVALANQGRPDEAIQWCQRAIEIDPTSARAHYTLGRMFYDKWQASRDGTNLVRAMEHWRRTIEIDPDYITAYSSMGVATAALGDVDGAIELYEQALAINPQHIPALVSLGAALEGQGRRDLAIEQYRKALDAAPGDVFLMNKLGIALARQGQLDEAIDLLTRALEIDPTNDAVRRNLAKAQADRGRTGPDS